jgi:Staphylococcal nuclease homologue
MTPPDATARSLARSRRRATRLLLVGLAVAALVALVLLIMGYLRQRAAGLDEYGGRFNERTGLYEYHHPSMQMAEQKRQYLNWVHYPIQGIVKGDVDSIAGPASFWLHMDYRPAYQELIQNVALPNRDDHKLLVRVDLAYVSPEETGSRDPKFAEYFRNKVEFELKQKLVGQAVTVNFSIYGGDLGRLRGMVFLGKEAQDNVNLWLVLNGWSYYVVGDSANPYDKRFREAEDLAKRDQAGIWKSIR